MKFETNVLFLLQINMKGMKIIKRNVVCEGSFVNKYLNDVTSLYGIQNGTELKILLYAWSKSKFNHSYFLFGKKQREEFESEYNVSFSSIEKSIASLVSKKIILKDHNTRNKYILNPDMFFNGKDLIKDGKVKVTIEYDLKGCDEHLFCKKTLINSISKEDDKYIEEVCSINR